MLFSFMFLDSFKKANKECKRLTEHFNTESENDAAERRRIDREHPLQKINYFSENAEDFNSAFKACNEQTTATESGPAVILTVSDSGVILPYMECTVSEKSTQTEEYTGN